MSTPLFTIKTIDHYRAASILVMFLECMLIILQLRTRLFCASSLGLVALISMGEIQDGCTRIKVYRHYAHDVTSVGCPHLEVKKRPLIGPNLCAAHTNLCVLIFFSSFYLKHGGWMRSMHKGLSNLIQPFL